MQIAGFSGGNEDDPFGIAAGHVHFLGGQPSVDRQTRLGAVEPRLRRRDGVGDSFCLLPGGAHLGQGGQQMIEPRRQARGLLGQAVVGWLSVGVIGPDEIAGGGPELNGDTGAGGVERDKPAQPADAA